MYHIRSHKCKWIVHDRPTIQRSRRVHVERDFVIDRRWDVWYIYITCHIDHTDMYEAVT